ncbi:hypothetical protein BKA62DRAFT_118119 [Auriculariales sp. MPI-PUGE-AT-0066]|nr:hypothetical protein BKA62DRAFT_118119 [Auriculariales sp. MPI-PUGE-AT-0066]
MLAKVHVVAVRAAGLQLDGHKGVWTNGPRLCMNVGQARLSQSSTCAQTPHCKFRCLLWRCRRWWKCWRWRMVSRGSSWTQRAVSDCPRPNLALPKLLTSLAIYEGLKVVVQGVANMTDGAPQPWKAIPQTVLQFTSIVERAIDHYKKYETSSIGSPAGSRFSSASVRARVAATRSWTSAWNLS